MEIIFRISLCFEVYKLFRKTFVLIEKYIFYKFFIMVINFDYLLFKKLILHVYLVL